LPDGVNDLGIEAQKPQLEDLEQATGPGANDYDVCLNQLGPLLSVNRATRG
jgi:hypothetical protein